MHRPHRSRLLGPLSGALFLALLVGGLVLGAAPRPSSAAGPELLYHLSLPGVAADSQPAPAADAVSTRHVAQMLDGSLVVTGEVHNGTDQTIFSIVVSATAKGVTRQSSALTYQVAPGGDALFQVILPGVTDANAAVTTAIVSYSVVPNPAGRSGLTATLSGIRALQVTVTDPNTGRTTVSDSPTVLVVPGSLTNNGSLALNDISLVLGFYDEAGNVRLVASTTTFNVLFRDPGDQTLQPGKTATFEVPVPRSAYLGVAGTLRTVAFTNARVAVP